MQRLCDVTLRLSACMLVGKYLTKQRGTYERIKTFRDASISCWKTRGSVSIGVGRMLGLIISDHVIEWQALAPLALASLLKQQLGLLCQGQ